MDTRIIPWGDVAQGDRVVSDDGKIWCVVAPPYEFGACVHCPAGTPRTIKVTLQPASGKARRFNFSADTYVHVLYE